MSLENQMVVNDVVETYIPIIINDRSVGTFELYYNITSRKESLDKLISRYNYLLYALSFMIIVAAWFTLFLFYKNIKERQKYEGNLFEMAKKDKLTNVYNRRMFVELLQ
ncbi:MAG: hypothetical protein GY777_02975, partial [Candidatus Brocadiaceae bacterium]|nr:hypothetical protein [Candidatus Brocadiaceae bacterium]